MEYSAVGNLFIFGKWLKCQICSYHQIVDDNSIMIFQLLLVKPDEALNQTSHKLNYIAANTKNTDHELGLSQIEVD